MKRVVDLAITCDNTHRGDHWDEDDNGNDVEKRVAQLLSDDEINTEYKDAFRQQTIIGWEYIFTGKFAWGWRKFWTERQQWASQFAVLMMKWDRACWSKRNRTLFGERRNRYIVTRRQLMAEAQVWRNATNTERLVGDIAINMRRKTLKTAASILIATWLDELMAQRRQIQRRQQENIIMNWTNPEELHDADE